MLAGNRGVVSAPAARPRCGLSPPRVAECDGVRGWCGCGAVCYCRVCGTMCYCRVCGAVHVWCYCSMCDGGAGCEGVEHVAKGEGARLWNVHMDGMDGGGTTINTAPGFSSGDIGTLQALRSSGPWFLL
nr:hypothetical protein Iba_chr09aCG5840 [Ipomoea batatas]